MLEIIFKNTIIPSHILIMLLIPIGLIHFYWTMGGKWGMNATTPTREDGTPLFIPRKIDCFVVGSGLILLSIVVMSRMHWFLLPILGDQTSNRILKTFALIFTLRAIGEFNHVGFFSKPRNSMFRKYDRRLYSPLCFLLGILLWSI
jgi:hypothetical protein